MLPFPCRPGSDRAARAGRFVHVFAAFLFALAGLAVCGQAWAQANNPPSFTSAASASVAENTTDTIITVAATDSDAEDSVTGYGLSQSTGDSAKFSLSGAALSFKTAPDFETPTDIGGVPGDNKYLVVVSATSGTDDREMTQTQTITVTVTDVNEAPEFTSGTSASVAENTTAVMTVAATDPDSSDSVTFSLTGGADQSKFSLSGAELSFASAPDFETPADTGDTAGNNTYVVEVTAKGGTGERAMSVAREITVTVTDVNEAPEFTSGTSASVAENTTAVMTVAATDPDSSDSVTFSLTGGADQSKFSLSGAELSFASAPDFETPTDAGDTAGNNTYVVEVTAKGGTGARAMSVAREITVTVTNVNEAPSFSASAQTRSVDENTAAETDIGPVLPAADDPDAGTTLTYTLQGTDKDSFDFDASARQIKTKAALDYETDESYSVTLRASDGSLSADLGVTINVNDLNDVAPTFANESETREVAENTGTGTAFGAAFSADDPDTVGSLTYSLEGTDASSFGFDATARRLETKAALDFEASKNEYSVTVRVSDGTNTDDTVAVTINVTNVNEAPMFGSETATRSIAENTASNTNIGAVITATDPENDSLTYTVSGSDFSIDASNGQLKTLGALNHEGTDSYEVTVTARDGAATPLSDTITVTIAVTDVNEAPEFPSGTKTRSVDENTAAETEFGDAVAATDPDDGDTLTYTLGGTNAGSFGINADTGRLKTKGALDFESKSSYQVTVTASDGKDPALTDTTDVNITIGDVNEPPDPPASPAVSGVTSSRITVGWTAPSNTGRPAITGYELLWTTSKASPVTPTPTTPVSLVSSATSHVARGLDPDTTYTFSIKATNDEGTGNAATVNGTTGANQAPDPRDASPEFSIAENTAADVAVGTVSATDPETDADGNNRPVTYAMKSGDTGAFNLDTSTGALTTKEHDYNYEADAEYNLVVAANDVHGGSADIAVTVNLTDVGGRCREPRPRRGWTESARRGWK